MKTNLKSWFGGIIGGFLAVGVCVGVVAANTPGATLGSAKIFIGNASGIAVATTLTGDVTNDNAGVTAIGGSKVTSAMIAANTIVTADLDPNVEQVANKQLTNTQVTALRATGITLTSVPAANTAFVVDMIQIVADDAGGAWTESADDLMVEYTGGTDIMGIDGTELVGGSIKVFYYYPESVPVIQASANQACTTTCDAGQKCKFGINQAAVGLVACSDATADSCYCVGAGLVPTAAQAIQIKQFGDGEWGGGNAADTMSIRVWYHQVSTIAFSSGG